MKLLIAVVALALAALAQTTTSPSPKAPSPSAPASSSSSKSPASPKTSASSTLPKRAALPPGIDEGVVQDHQYSSDYFGFRFKFPEHLNVNDDFLAGAQDESGRSFLLFAASGGAVVRAWEDTAGRAAAAQTLTIFADQLAALGATDARAYVVQVTQPLFARQGFTAQGPIRSFALAGHTFVRSDFTKQGTAEMVLVTVLRGYAISFLVMAPSRTEVDQIAESFKTMEFSKASDVPRRSMPGSAAPGQARSKSEAGKP